MSNTSTTLDVSSLIASIKSINKQNVLEAMTSSELKELEEYWTDMRDKWVDEKKYYEDLQIEFSKLSTNLKHTNNNLGNAMIDLKANYKLDGKTSDFQKQFDNLIQDLEKKKKFIDETVIPFVNGAPSKCQEVIDEINKLLSSISTAIYMVESRESGYGV